MIPLKKIGQFIIINIVIINETLQIPSQISQFWFLTVGFNDFDCLQKLNKALNMDMHWLAQWIKKKEKTTLWKRKNNDTLKPIVQCQFTQWKATKMVARLSVSTSPFCSYSLPLIMHCQLCLKCSQLVMPILETDHWCW